MLPVLILIILSGFHLVFAIRTNLFFSQDDFAVLAYFKNHGVVEMIQIFLTRGDIWGFRKIIGYLDLRLIYDFFGTNSIAYILNNHVWHTLNVILVYLILLSLTRGKLKSLFAAVIFNATYLMYFSNVHECIVTTFSLGSIYIYIENKRYFWSWILFFLGLLTKELALSTIFALVMVTIYRKEDIKRLIPFGMLSIAYVIYQINFAVGKMVLASDHPYATVADPLTWWHNFVFYVSVPWMILLVVILFLSIRKKTWMLLVAFFVCLLPAIILKNRQEMYYWYLPSAYLALCLGSVLPKLNIRTWVMYLLILLMLGRKVLPPLAKENYPNWQKQSILRLVNQIEEELKNNPDKKAVQIPDKIERDARLMLGSNVTDLFLQKEVSDKYLLEYNQAQNEIRIAKR